MEETRTMESTEVMHQRNKLRFYKNKYQVEAPFKVMCDPEFLDLMRNNKTVTVNMNKVLGKNRKLFTPRCVFTRADANAASNMKEILATVEAVECSHKSWQWNEYDIDPKVCIQAILVPENSGSFILATVDVERGTAKLEQSPSIPVMIGNADGSVRILEPSDSQKEFAEDMDEAMVDYLKERKKQWKKMMRTNKKMQRENDINKAKNEDNQRQLKLRKAAEDKNKAERKARLHRASRSSSAAGSSSRDI